MIIGIHYLRAIAALMVVFHHTLKYTNIKESSSFGASGVDIFFVISGFVMAWTTRDIDPRSNRFDSAKTFLRHRFIRVVPLYWIALLWNIKADVIKHSVPEGAWLDFAFIPRFNALQEGGIFPLLVPGWTINYEMFFYAIFAFSIFFGKWRMAALFSAMLAFICLGHLVQPTSAPAIFYSDPIILEFLYGAALCMFVKKYGFPQYSHWAWAGVIVGFLALFIATQHGHAVSRGLTAGPCAVLIIFSSMSAFRQSQIPIFNLLANASFSIYLSHSFTFKVSGHLFDAVFPDQQGIAIDLAEIIFRMMVAALIGVLAHWYIEKPIIRFLQPKHPSTSINSRT
ncbi:acyltransferase family protein [Aquabacterium sp.]|uniref:acyltransferase family protein n=1 Tax=Aquabacterium sp. TaxID=1872578 RepID=UPI003D6D5D05